MEWGEQSPLLLLMDLYIAIRGHKRGKVFDYHDGNLEECILETQEGKLLPAGYTGLIIPFSAMADDVIKLARRGQQVDDKIYEHYKH